MSDFWKSLRVTIVDAYSLEDLDMVLAEELSKNLRSTIQVGPMDLVVFQLLRAAKNQGWLVPLLEALKRRRPESQAFQLAMDRSIQVLNMPNPQLDADLDEETAPSRAVSDVVKTNQQFLFGLGSAAAIAAIFFAAWHMFGPASRPPQTDAALSITTFSAENNAPIPSVAFQYYRPNEFIPTPASSRGATWTIPLNEVAQNTQIELAPNVANLTPEQLENRDRLTFEIKKIHFGDPRNITLFIKLNSRPKGGQ